MVNGLFVTGTDTEVGKTFVTCALASAFKRRGIRVGVMKPIATGCRRINGSLVSEDARQLIRASGARDSLDEISPYRFEPPVAPWVALRQAQGERHGRSNHFRFSVRGEPVEPRTIRFDRIEQAFRELSSRYDFLLVEGIGGLLVPIDAKRTVADLARRLGLPILIVSRASLGTINHTLLTIEAARNEGLDIFGVVLNQRSLKPTLAERTNSKVIQQLGNVPIFGVIPRLKVSARARAVSYLKVEEMLRCLRERQSLTAHRPKRLAAIDQKKIWHPFTQMSEWERSEPLIIESADGVHLTDVKGRRFLDGVSSLWVNLHGHRHPDLDRALRRQVGKIAHSTLLGAANVSSIELAEELLKIAPKGLARVFYSDNGSTAVEIALKMAFQYWQQNGARPNRRFVHFTNAYHGDTIGSVSVGGIDLFHQVYGPLLFKGFKVPSPYCYRCPLKLTVPSCRMQCLEPFEETLKKHHREIAAVVVEPLVQGASGMMTQPPGWLKRVERVCRRYGIFLIADEVAVGFGRTGTMFACEQEKVRPDFLCVAKGLSGGYLPLAATLTTEKVYKGFLGSFASQRTFFHGHSYTGNPLACAVALENLRIFKREQVLKKIKPKIKLFSRELERFKTLPHVGEVRQKGLIAGIELVEEKKSKRPYPWEQKIGIQVCQVLRGKGILLRPLGNVIVLLPPLAISLQELRFLCRETRAAIQQITESLPS